MKKLKRIDIMCDIETLGIKDSATITQVAAIAFDITTGELIDGVEYFNEFVDLSKVPDELISIDIDTLRFWTKNDHNTKLFTNLLNSDGESEKDVLLKFHSWLKNLSEKTDKLTLWGNGISFDNVKIKNKMNLYGIEYPINFWNERDVRTIVDLVSEKENISEKDFKKRYYNDQLHDAIADTKNQIKYSSDAYQLLIK